MKLNPYGSSFYSSIFSFYILYQIKINGKGIKLINIKKGMITILKNNLGQEISYLFFGISLKFICKIIYPRTSSIIKFAILPYHLNIVYKFLDRLIFVTLKFFPNSSKIHRISYYDRIIMKT